MNKLCPFCNGDPVIHDIHDDSGDTNFAIICDTCGASTRIAHSEEAAWALWNTRQVPSYTQPLVHLPGTSLNPSVVLHRTLNKIDQIASVVVLIQWSDTSFGFDHSEMALRDLCMAEKVFSMRVEDELKSPD